MSESPSPNGWTTMNKRPRYKRLADDDVNPKENYYVSLAATMLLLLIAVPAWGPYTFSQIWRCREALKMIRIFALCHPLLWPRWLTDLSRSTSRLSKKAGWRCLKAKVRTAGGGAGALEVFQLSAFQLWFSRKSWKPCLMLWTTIEMGSWDRHVAWRVHGQTAWWFQTWLDYCP